MFLLLLILPTSNFSLPTSYASMRMEQMLLLTPMNTYILDKPGERIEDFFLSRSTFYARSTLLCIDGVPLPNYSIAQLLNEGIIPFLAIDHIEILQEDAGIWGNYDEVINIVTKRAQKKPYSKILFTKNPTSSNFVFGREIRKDIDIYTSMQDSIFWGTCGYKIKNGEFRVFLLKNLPIFKADYSGMHTEWSKDYFSLFSNINIKNHRICYGGDRFNDTTKIFLIDHFELFRLLYLAPSIRYDGTFYSKISLAYILNINTSIFCSYSEKDFNTGIRFYENRIILCQKIGENGLDFYSKIDLFENFRIRYNLSGLENPSYIVDYNLLLEYSKEFSQKKLGVKVSCNIANNKDNFIRLGFRILDVEFHYRFIQDEEPFYGFSWEFWN